MPTRKGRGMRTLGKMIAALSLTLVAAPAAAQATATQTLDDIEAGGQDGEMTKLLLFGMASGWLWANVELESKGLPPLYCQPRRFTVTANVAAEVLRKYVEDHPVAGKYATGMILLSAFQYAFPCEQG